MPARIGNKFFSELSISIICGLYTRIKTHAINQNIIEHILNRFSMASKLLAEVWPMLNIMSLSYKDWTLTL